jgi:hypothetical protein
MHGSNLTKNLQEGAVFLERLTIYQKEKNHENR